MKKTIDFGIGWPIAGDTQDLFIRSLEDECACRSLSFVFIDETSLEPLNSEIKTDRKHIRFFVDMASEITDPQNPFTRFVYTLKDAGSRIVDDPDTVKSAADKSITHFDLVRAQVPTPYTVLIRNWEPTRRLTDEERQGLGSPMVIKPALGYAQKGVRIITQRSTLKEIAEARTINEGDNFLLQRYIDPLVLDGKTAWFRVFHLFGEIFPCWWDPATHVYSQVTLKDMDQYKLMPLIRLAAEIARITRVDWFSCEIAIAKENEQFVVIDYMNDQCALYPQSQEKDGVPDDLIVLFASRIVAKAWDHLHGKYTLSHRAVWLPRIKVRDEDT